MRIRKRCRDKGPDDFSEEIPEACRGAQADISGKSAVVVFEDAECVIYAAAVVRDENENKDIGAGSMYLPRIMDFQIMRVRA